MPWEVLQTFLYNTTHLRTQQTHADGSLCHTNFLCFSKAARRKVLEIPKMTGTSLPGSFIYLPSKGAGVAWHCHALPCSFLPFFPILQMPSSSAPQYHAQQRFPAGPARDNAHCWRCYSPSHLKKNLFPSMLTDVHCTHI